MKRILVMGLPGTGKTTFAEELKKELNNNLKTVVWYNADIVRKLKNDWDFSHEGRLRQAERMRKMANEHMNIDYVICDFVAPLKEMRDIFAPDYLIWLDTEKSSTYQDTDKIFEEPQYGEWDFIVNTKDEIIIAAVEVAEDILRLK